MTNPNSHSFLSKVFGDINNFIDKQNSTKSAD